MEEICFHSGLFAKIWNICSFFFFVNKKQVVTQVNVLDDGEKKRTTPNCNRISYSRHEKQWP